jgi:hypothetical protein
MRVQIFPKSFWPKWRFVKSIPGVGAHVVGKGLPLVGLLPAAHDQDLFVGQDAAAGTDDRLRGPVCKKEL